MIARRALLGGTAALLGTTGLGLTGCGSAVTRRIEERARRVPGIAEVDLTAMLSFASSAAAALVLEPGVDAAAAHRAVAEFCRICVEEQWSAPLEVRREPGGGDVLRGSTAAAGGPEDVADWFVAADALVGAAVLNVPSEPGRPTWLDVTGPRLADDLAAGPALAVTRIGRWQFREPDGGGQYLVERPAREDAERWGRLTAAVPVPPITDVVWIVSRTARVLQYELHLALVGDPEPAAVDQDAVMDALAPLLTVARVTRSEAERIPLSVVVRQRRDNGGRTALAEWRSAGGRTPPAPLNERVAALLPLEG